MPRRLRFAPPGYWLHLTQRGNNKPSVFSTDADRQHFLDLVEQHSEERDVRGNDRIHGVAPFRRRGHHAAVPLNHAGNGRGPGVVLPRASP